MLLINFEVMIWQMWKNSIYIVTYVSSDDTTFTFSASLILFSLSLAINSDLYWIFKGCGAVSFNFIHFRQASFQVKPYHSISSLVY